MEENVIQIESGIMTNVDASVNPTTCSCKNGKYFASITDNSVITCDEIIDVKEAKKVTTNFNEKSSL